MEKHIDTVESLQTLSYYSLCKLSRLTSLADPIHGFPILVANGEYEGIGMFDEYGNLISVE